jgi:NAD+ dependent glucose-6-phosphate dehydrogenase
VIGARLSPTPLYFASHTPPTHRNEHPLAKKKVLVTGLRGTVGQAIRSEFEGRYELSGFSRYGAEDLPDERNHKGNIADRDSVVTAFQGQHTVVHLAADRSATADWESALRNNFVGTYNIFEAAKLAGVKRVVFGSSQHSIGGNYLDEPYRSILAGEFDKVTRPYPLMDESIAIRPSGYYGASKAYGEALGSVYKDYYGVNSIHVRIGWTISNNDPRSSGGGLAMWLSSRDTAQIMYKAVDAPDDLDYAVVFATSNNYWNIFNLDKARKLLGYDPQDDAGKLIDPNSKLPDRDRTEFKENPEDPD